jgi:diguanylate cyclase (GGDEF)-like protein/PAS domain S-box-containing protein
MDYSAFDLLPEALLVIDENYKIVFANKRAKEVYGSFSDTCYGLSHGFPVPCYEVEEHPCPVKNIKEHGLKRSGVVHLHRTEEGEGYFYVVAEYDPKERVFVELHIDLSELAKAFGLSSLKPEIVFSMGPVVFFQWERKEGWPVKFVSPNVMELFGYTAEDFLSGRVRYDQVVHPEDLPRVAKEVEFHTANRSPSWTHEDYRIITKEGKIKWVLDHTVPLLDERGEVVGYYGYLIDITEKHEKEEIFRVLAEANPHGVLLYDFESNKIMYANRSITRISGYSMEELLSMEDPLSFIDPLTLRRAEEAIERRKGGYKGLISYRIRVRTKGGKYKWLKLSSVVVSYRGKPVSVITLVDISKEVSREKRLVELATRDQLTGIFNRHALIEHFEHLIAQAERYNAVFSILMFDIDNFKRINDTYGHILGDKVLKEVAKATKGVLRRSDLFGRWGGEEFVVLLPMTSDPSSPAEKVRQAVESCGLCQEVGVTVSVGATAYRSGDSLDSMVARADEALYIAKKQGKNRVVVL